MHGHVHANSVTKYGGITFVTSAAADEYPMHWREVIVRQCEVELRTHPIPIPPDILEKSRLREAGRGDPTSRNSAKRGAPRDNHAIIRIC